MDTVISITHWLPIITFCPVNKLPDLIYVTVTFKNTFRELYAVRKQIRAIASRKLRFMEDIAWDIAFEFPEAIEVKVQLVTGRHIVIISRS